MRKTIVHRIGIGTAAFCLVLRSAFAAEINTTVASSATNVPSSVVEKAARFYGEERWPGCRIISITPYYAFDGSINAYAVQFAKKGSPLAGETEINAQFLLGEQRLDEVKANRPVPAINEDAAVAGNGANGGPLPSAATVASQGPSTAGIQVVLPPEAPADAGQAPEEAAKQKEAYATWRQQVRAAANDAVLPDQVGTAIIAARHDLYPLLERFDGVAPHIQFQTKVRRLAAIPKDQAKPVARTFYVGPMAYFHEPATPKALATAAPAQVVNPLSEQVFDLTAKKATALQGRLAAAEPGKWPVPPQEVWNSIELTGVPPTAKEPVLLGSPTYAIQGVPYYHQDDYGANSCGPVASAQALGYWDDNGYGNLIDNGYSTTGHEEELIYNLMRAEGYDPNVGTYDNAIKPGIEAVCNTDGYGRNVNMTVYELAHSVAWNPDIVGEINWKRPFVFGNFDTASYPYWAHFTTGVGYNQTSGHLLYVNYNYPPDTPKELNWDNIAQANQHQYKIGRNSAMFDCPWSEDFEGNTSAHWKKGGNSAGTWMDTIYRAHNYTPNCYPPPAGNKAFSSYCVGSQVPPPGPYPKNANGWMSYGPFSTVGKSSGELSAYIWRRIPETDGSDYVGLFASVDGTNFSGAKFFGDYPSWNRCTLDLANVYGLGNTMNRSQVWVAIWFHSDGDNFVGEGAYVDDIAIRLYPASGIRVTSPKGGEMWKHSTSHTLTWLSMGNLGLGGVQIDLYRSGVFYRTITASALNTGAFSWTVQKYDPPGTDYQFKISQLTDPTHYGFSAGNFEIYADPSITVIAPNGGEVWQRGTTGLVQWSWTGYPGKDVSVSLYKGAAIPPVIFWTVPNTGTFQCGLPGSLTPGSDYRLRVYGEGGIYDESNGNFSIIQPSLTVLKPVGGEWFQKGQTYDLAWTWQGDPGPNSKIDLYLGHTIYPIAASVPNVMSGGSQAVYAWTISMSLPVASGYRVKITSLSNSAYSDYSEPFRIVDSDSIHVTSPNGGEWWVTDSANKITWTSTHVPPAKAKIEIYRQNLFRGTITPSTDNDGSYTWTIPKSWPPASDYRIRVSLTSPTAVGDFSDNYFRIAAPQISVLWPPDGAVLSPGSVQLLQWQSSDFFSPVGAPRVKLELYRDGVFDLRITSSTADTGLFRWVIPPTLPPGSHFQLKISFTGDPSIFGLSEGRFAIQNAPAIVLSSPNGNERWLRGSQHVILWRSNGLPDTDAKLELYKGGVLHSQIAAQTRLLDGAFTWKVPFTLPPGGDYKIRITSLYDPAVFDWSNLVFTVEGNTSVRGARWSLY